MQMRQTVFFLFHGRSAAGSLIRKAIVTNIF